MTIDSDFHSHVSRSSALQMAQSAREKGLRVLGLSEHVFQMSEARQTLEHLALEGPLLTLPTYVEAVQTTARHSGIDVRLGLAVDFIPGKNEDSREEGERRWLRYFELLRQAVSSGYFSLVSHPIRLRVKNQHLPAQMDEELEQLAAEATRYDVALEINGYDVLGYPSLVRRLARACALHNTPVSVGSDAHNPMQVAQAHAPSEAILREAGIKKVRIWKQRVAEEYKL